MKYSHQFQVIAPLQAVIDFHRRSASMADITPPPVIARIQAAPECLSPGDRMDFTLWLGPIPVYWSAQIDAIPGSGFADRQVEGPFQSWVHRHQFVRLDDHTTLVQDQIEAQFKLHPVWGLIGLGMWISLPVLFAYRGWKTSRLLAAK
jgi:ligand-binding SRPBCC domain-containing protein